DTLSTLRQRIQVQVAGIRSARLWRQVGGHRWQLVFSRRKLLKELYPLLHG
ncbi:lysogenization regulator HflD, partial [Pseudomonas syringae pv. actinidiae]|nr:lysogenization regulator HflD [Pseudomonas syringae pv. actinidiae]